MKALKELVAWLGVMLVIAIFILGGVSLAAVVSCMVGLSTCTITKVDK